MEAGIRNDIGPSLVQYIELSQIFYLAINVPINTTNINAWQHSISMGFEPPARRNTRKKRYQYESNINKFHIDL